VKYQVKKGYISAVAMSFIKQKKQGRFVKTHPAIINPVHRPGQIE
jgi:hypothetical protein